MSIFTSLQVDSPISYLIAVILPALDAIVPVVPSETAVIALGVATAGSTNPRIALLVFCAAAGAFLGDNVSYLLGRRFGPSPAPRSRPSSGPTSVLDRPPRGQGLRGQAVGRADHRVWHHHRHQRSHRRRPAARGPPTAGLAVSGLGLSPGLPWTSAIGRQRPGACDDVTEQGRRIRVGFNRREPVGGSVLAR
jgi:hypothetical protein